MAVAIGLPAKGYDGTYKLIGGAPALDFANLVSYRGTDREHDWLEPAGNATRWAAAAGLPAPGRAALAGLRDFRETLARAFLAVADGTAPATADLDRIGSIAAASEGRRRLRFPVGAAAADWSDPAPDLLGALAVDAVGLLSSPERLGRIAACPECRWLFLDTSRNRSRRWCDPADCGNRARQRRHYRRARA